MVKLSIIIPYHNESNELIFPLYQSLNYQMGINWDDIEIIVSNNCDIPDDKTEFFAQFENIKNRIKYIPGPKGSWMGQNRQNGLRIARGEYVIFIDSDDQMNSSVSLLTVLNAIKSNDDMYSSRIIQDHLTWNRGSVINAFPEDIPPTNLVLHGKIYKRKWLVENNLYFCPYIRAYEDLYFNWLAFVIADSKWVYVDTPFYYWKTRLDSTGRAMGTAVDDYCNYYNEDSFIYMYYANMRLKLNGELSEEFKGAIHMSIVTIYNQRYRIAGTLDYADHIAGLILKEFDVPVDKLLSDSSIVNSPDIKFADWIDRIMQVDVEWVKKHYNIRDIDAENPYKRGEMMPV